MNELVCRTDIESKLIATKGERGVGEIRLGLTYTCSYVQNSMLIFLTVG